MTSLRAILVLIVVLIMAIGATEPNRCQGALYEICFWAPCPPCIGDLSTGICCDHHNQLYCFCMKTPQLKECVNNTKWNCTGKKYTIAICTVLGCQGTATGADCGSADFNWFHLGCPPGSGGCNY
jgi:hypothetical protein